MFPLITTSFLCYMNKVYQKKSKKIIFKNMYLIYLTWSRVKIKKPVFKLTSYNYFHNILRRFDVSKNFPFTTSETMRDYFSRSALFNMETTRASLKYFVNGCLWKHFFASNLPQTHSNLNSWLILVALRTFT